MHVACAADDGVDWAGLNAFGATNAVGLHDPRHLRRFAFAAVAVVGAHGHTEDVGECARAGVTPRRTAFHTGLAARHRLGIWAAAIEAALSALGLRQDAVEAFGQLGGRGHGVGLGIGTVGREHTQ